MSPLARIKDKSPKHRIHDMTSEIEKRRTKSSATRERNEPVLCVPVYARHQRKDFATASHLDHQVHRNPLDRLQNTSSRSLSLTLCIPSFDLRLRGLDLLRQKLHAFISPSTVGQMRRQDTQSTDAHRIARLTYDLDLVLGEVGDLVSVLRLLGVAVEHYTSDLVLDTAV
jgi:hypothetical protein